MSFCQYHQRYVCASLQQVSEDGQSVSWYTAASKTLRTYGATLVVVSPLIQRALEYYVRHLRPLITAELPRNGKLCAVLR